MSTTVDTLVTKYVLDDSQYSAKARNVQASTGQMGGSFGGAAMLAGGLATAVTVAGAAAIALGGRASQTAANFEVLRKSIETVTGSAGRAQEVFDFVQKQAGPSAFFGVKELGEAAKLLEAFKLNTEEFLPLGNTMASLFGQNAESLNSFVMALGRIKAGSFGEGFERLREMGVTRPMLEAEGARFNNQGQFQGTPDAALAAIKRAIEKNFGGLDAAMMGTFQAQLASSGDLVERAFGQVGQGINDGLLPALKGFNESLTNIVEGGSLVAFGQMLADSVPGIVQNFQFLADQFINSPLGAAFGLPGAKADAERTAAMNAETAAMQKIRGKDGLTSEERIARNKANDPANKEAFTGEKPAKDSAVPPIVRQSTVFLGEIAANTRESAKGISKMAFGYGAGAAGVTTSELSEFKPKRGGGKIMRGVVKLAQDIEEAMIETYMQGESARRQSFGRA